MKLTENTKVRVRVPKHLYEAIQAELAKKEEMKEAISGKAEELKNFYEKVKEQVDGGTDLDSAISFVMNDLGIEMMEESIEEEQMDEWVGVNPADDTFTLMLGLAIPVLTALIAAGPKTIGQAAWNAAKAALSKKKKGEEPKEEEVNEWVGVNPDHDTLTLMLGLAIPALTALIAAGPKAIGQAAWNAAKAALSKKKKGGEEKPTETVAEEVEEIEEALDLETLMEAVKDAAKKKAEEKKKKEAEAKKKKEAEDKKKAEEKKKKEAEAKKKAEAAKKK